MSEFVSVFDLAGESAEEAMSSKAMALAMQVSSPIQQFLFQASNEGDFGHRLAMAEDRLLHAAHTAGVSVDSLVEEHRRGFGLVMEARRASAPPLVMVAAPAQVSLPDLDTIFARVGGIRTALEEGQDPLAWLEGEDGGQGQAEKPSEAGIEAAHEGGRKEALWPNTKPQAPSRPTAPSEDPLAGRETCTNCGSRMTKATGADGMHKCFNCDASFKATSSRTSALETDPF